MAAPRQGTPTGVGSTTAVSRLGEVLHRLGAGPELLVVDVDPATVDDARRIL
jgi:predicted amidohydrolase